MIVDDGEVIGLCSLVKAPSGEAIDIGYGIAEGYRSRGYARGAIKAIVNWAKAEKRVLTCRAETSVDNIPSQRVLEHNGFQRIGTRTDEEDGDLICWSIEVPAD